MIITDCKDCGKMTAQEIILTIFKCGCGCHNEEMREE